MNLLIDTNVYTAFMSGNQQCTSHIRSAEQVLMSSVVAGELLFGFRHGSRFEENRTQLKEFLSHPFVELLPVTLITADRFGLVASALKRRGTPIPTNDMWIAAHALETGADLLSFDKHFSAIDGLAFTHVT